MNIKRIIVGLVLLVTLTSCIKERFDTSQEGIPTTLYLKTRGVGDSEFEINNLRVMVFRSGGERIYNKFYNKDEIGDPTTIQTTTGERKLLIIANEPAALTSALDAALTLGQVNALILATTYVSGDILPFTYLTNVTVKETNNTPIAAKLERVVSKAALRISKSNELSANNIELLEVQLIQAAKRSWLLPLSAGDWVANGGEATPLKDFSLLTFSTDNTLGTTTPKTVHFDEYIFEYHTAGFTQTDADAATALYIKISYDGVEKTYKLPFFFKNGDEETIYGVNRNSFFTVDATVYPKGLRIDKYNVNPWDDLDPWDKDIDPDAEDDNTSVDGWIDDSGTIEIEGLKTDN